MNLIKQIFDNQFYEFEIRLPETALRLGARGLLEAEGWHILYCCEVDSDGIYLEYLAYHRMMNGESRVAIYENGRICDLPHYLMLGPYVDKSGRRLSVAESRELKEQIRLEMVSKGLC